MKKRTIFCLMLFGFFLALFATILPDIEEIIKDNNQGNGFDWEKEAAKKKKQFETA